MAWPEAPTPSAGVGAVVGPDLHEVRGQPLGRLAVEVAAAGGHHLLFLGPPGSGKTMLARRLPSLLPPLDDAAALEVAVVRSAAGVLPPDGPLDRTPPFSAPHHGVSATGLVGGGSTRLRPGALTLAHCGVLFLDEMGEFAPHALEMLRQPLEEGRRQAMLAIEALRRYTPGCEGVRRRLCAAGVRWDSAAGGHGDGRWSPPSGTRGGG